MYLMIAIQYGHVLGSFEKMLDCKCLRSGFQTFKSFEILLGIPTMFLLPAIACMSERNIGNATAGNHVSVEIGLALGWLVISTTSPKCTVNISKPFC
jgi:hypothetical protein